MAKEIQLKYGCNPNQKPARIYMRQGDELPVKVLNGNPGYINFLDALNSWQLVKELKTATNMSCAASFKHVSPAGAAIGKPLSETEKKIYFVEEENLSPLACAYVRARGADRMSSYGDWAALSDICDRDTAMMLKPEVSDGVIAPGYSREALDILKTKKKGNYNVIQIEEGYIPQPTETKDVFGVTFEQRRNDVTIDASCLQNIVTDNRNLPEEARNDLLLTLITLKYTQSNSVAYAKGGQIIGVGAGQQSRVHCVRLAGDKADHWWLRQHPSVLALPFKKGIRRAERDNAIDGYIGNHPEDVLKEGAWQIYFTEKPALLTEEMKKAWIAKNTDVSLGSDAFFPFGDNIERANQSGVKYIVQPGGSIRDEDVIAVANRYNMVMICNRIRLFHH